MGNQGNQGNQGNLGKAKRETRKRRLGQGWRGLCERWWLVGERLQVGSSRFKKARLTAVQKKEPNDIKRDGEPTAQSNRSASLDWRLVRGQTAVQINTVAPDGGLRQTSTVQRSDVCWQRRPEVGSLSCSTVCTNTSCLICTTTGQVLQYRTCIPSMITQTVKLTVDRLQCILLPANQLNPKATLTSQKGIAWHAYSQFPASCHPLNYIKTSDGSNSVFAHNLNLIWTFVWSTPSIHPFIDSSIQLECVCTP